MRTRITNRTCIISKRKFKCVEQLTANDLQPGAADGQLCLLALPVAHHLIAPLTCSHLSADRKIQIIAIGGHADGTEAQIKAFKFHTVSSCTEKAVFIFRQNIDTLIRHIILVYLPRKDLLGTGLQVDP